MMLALGAGEIPILVWLIGWGARRERTQAVVQAAVATGSLTSAGAGGVTRVRLSAGVDRYLLGTSGGCSHWSE